MTWNVVQTHPLALNKAIRNLSAQSFEPFSPKCRERGRVVALFNNYVFVRAQERWRCLASTIGVSRLLMMNENKPATVPEDFVVDLMKRQDDDGLVVLNSRFSRGQKLELRTPNNSSLVLFDGQKSKDRVFVLMSFLGSMRRTEVKEADLFEYA